MHRTRKIYLSAGATVQGGGAGGFDPLSLSPTAWYDPSDLSTLFQDSAGTTPVTADGDVVGLMQDKSGNGNHLTQGTTANKPLYKTAGGLHWLEYDGVNDDMSVATSPFTQPISIYTGGRITDLVNVTNFIRGNVATGDLRMGGTTDGDYRLYAGATLLYNTVRDANDHLLCGIANGASSSIRLDGVEVATGDAGSNSMDDIQVAGTEAGTFMEGRVYGIVLFDGTITAGDQTSLETWLAAKSGVTL